MILGIIQARMGSARLPGKMMSLIGGKTLIRHCIDQVKQSTTINKVLVATTEGPEDDTLAEFVMKTGCDVFRGSSKDVLDRFYKAAKSHKADVVVRICGDCPFIDPEIIDKTVQYFLDAGGRYDYVSNVHPPSFPDGYDVEVFTFNVLEHVWMTANLTSQREHVTTTIWEYPDTYRVGVLSNEDDLSKFRVVVDEPEDLEMLSLLYSKLGSRSLTLNNVIELLQASPDIREINSSFEREAGYRKSLAEDKNYER